jgi:2-polyprenyl-6-hydroxyphenyl methylase/3-demethylubiquinone-9 3-methyltransferase
VADNKTDEGRAKNRRVEIEVVGTRTRSKYFRLVCKPARPKPRRRGFFLLPQGLAKGHRVHGISAISRYYSNLCMNADPLEIQKFSELAHRWWDPTSEFRPLHEINPLRLEWINARVPLAGKNVIDIGCGGGMLSESMARKGAKVDRHRPVEKGAESGRPAQPGVGRRGALQAHRRRRHGRARKPGQYDVVTCMEMLEHVPDPASIVRAAATLVKPGGRVFFSTINRNPKAYLFAVIGAEYCCACCRAAPTTTPNSSPGRAVAIHARAAGLQVDGSRA